MMSVICVCHRWAVDRAIVQHFKANTNVCAFRQMPFSRWASRRPGKTCRLVLTDSRIREKSVGCVASFLLSVFCLLVTSIDNACLEYY